MKGEPDAVFVPLLLVAIGTSWHGRGRPARRCRTMADVTRTATGPLTAEELTDWYAEPAGHGDGPWVRAGLITTLDGRTAGPDGTSSSLNAGSAGDAAVFRHLRGWADVVVVGAGTVRAEGYRPLPGVPLAVVSTREELPPNLRGPAGPGDGQVVLLSGHGEALSGAEVRDAVLERGWRRVLLEGGPSLLAPWLREDLVDELCVTVRPVLAGGDGPLLVGRDVGLGGLQGVPSHVLVWDGDLLVRTRLR